MSKTDKPDPARGWLFVEKLLIEDESARLAYASDEEVDRRMDELNVEPSHIPSAEELLARAMERAAKSAASGDRGGAKAKALSVQQRTQWLALLAAAAIGGLVVAVVMNRIEPPVAHPRPHDESTVQQRTGKLRDEAYATCGQGLWTRCEGKLDEARELDPAGESDGRVIAARAAIEKAQHPAAGTEKGR